MSDALPTPGYEMGDTTAADWLLDIAQLYTGPDRMHVRALALRLSTRGAEADEATAEARAAKIDSARRHLADLESELADLPCEVDDARADLAKLEAAP